MASFRKKNHRAHLIQVSNFLRKKKNVSGGMSIIALKLLNGGERGEKARERDVLDYIV